MSSILSSLRKLSDKIFGRAADDFVGEQVFQNTAPDPLTKAANASCGAETSEGAPAPSAPYFTHPHRHAPPLKTAEERAIKNTAPDPLTKAANASCGAEPSEGAPAPSDHTGKFRFEVICSQEEIIAAVRSLHLEELERIRVAIDEAIAGQQSARTLIETLGKPFSPSTGHRDQEARA
jgi:hypothetical protein